VLCGETLLHHLAAAFRRPAVCLLSGFLPPSWVWYGTSMLLCKAQALPCWREKPGCWRSRVVPLGDGDSKDRDSLCRLPVVGEEESVPKCMQLITAEEVMAVVLTYNGTYNRAL
jgi:hypothetical protein